MIGPLRFLFTTDRGCLFVDMDWSILSYLSGFSLVFFTQQLSGYRCHEKNVSAKQDTAGTHAWFSCANENEGRPQGIKRSQSQGTRKTGLVVLCGIAIGSPAGIGSVNRPITSLYLPIRSSLRIDILLSWRGRIHCCMPVWGSR